MDPAHQAYWNAYRSRMASRGRPGSFKPTLAKTTVVTATKSPIPVKTSDPAYGQSLYLLIDPVWQRVVDIAYLIFWKFAFPIIIFRIARWFCAEGFLGEPGQYLARILRVPEFHFQPNYASPWANAVVHILLFLRHPIRTIQIHARNARDWTVQKYYQLRYNQRVDNISRSYRAVTAWIGEHVWHVVFAFLFVATVWWAVKIQYDRWIESRRVIPWYDHRSVRINVAEPELMRFDEEIKASAIKKDQPVNTMEDDSSKVLSVESLVSKDGALFDNPPEIPLSQLTTTSKSRSRKAETIRSQVSSKKSFVSVDSARLQDSPKVPLSQLTTTSKSRSRKPEIIRSQVSSEDSFASVDGAHLHHPSEVPVQQLTATSKSKSWKPESIRPASRSVTTIRETVSKSTSAFSRPPRVTSVKEIFEKEKAGRILPDTRPKDTISEGRWEPWKEDMAKDPQKRRWVGQGLTWCLACKQYHCCELPY